MPGELGDLLGGPPGLLHDVEPSVRAPGHQEAVGHKQGFLGGPHDSTRHQVVDFVGPGEGVAQLHLHGLLAEDVDAADRASACDGELRDPEERGTARADRRDVEVGGLGDGELPDEVEA